MDNHLSRRNFLQKGVISCIGLSTISPLTAWAKSNQTGMKFGLVTYQWAKDWDLPTLIANCTKTGMQGVELRTEHAHGVEINLNKAKRAEVKKNV